MALTLDDLFESPDHYLQCFEGDAALFLPMDRAAYHRSIFLDARISPAADQVMRLPAAALARTGKPAATGWIFHVAHCGSTLLARALDDPQANLVLREPLSLRQSAVDPRPGRLALVMQMLAKRYRADAPTVVKANVPVNFLLPEIAAIDPRAPAILLYATLPDYLHAILRSDDHRGWLRRVTGQLAPHLGDLSTLTDAERAAALWLAQMRAFAAATAALPNARTLDAERFFADPCGVLRASARLLSVDLDDTGVDGVVAGPLFSTYSKNPGVAFDNAARLQRRAALARSLADEVAAAQAWIERTSGETAPHMATIAAAALDA